MSHFSRWWYYRSLLVLLRLIAFVVWMLQLRSWSMRSNLSWQAAPHLAVSYFSSWICACAASCGSLLLVVIVLSFMSTAQTDCVSCLECTIQSRSWSDSTSGACNLREHLSCDNWSATLEWPSLWALPLRFASALPYRTASRYISAAAYLLCINEAHTWCLQVTHFSD